MGSLYFFKRMIKKAFQIISIKLLHIDRIFLRNIDILASTVYLSILKNNSSGKKVEKALLWPCNHTFAELFSSRTINQTDHKQ